MLSLLATENEPWSFPTGSLLNKSLELATVSWWRKIVLIDGALADISRPQEIGKSKWVLCLHGSALLYSIYYSLYYGPKCSVPMCCHSISWRLPLCYFVVLFVCVCCRLLSVICCNLDSFLLLESQYNICSMLLQSQRENVTQLDTDEGYEPVTTSLERYSWLYLISTHGHLDSFHNNLRIICFV